MSRELSFSLTKVVEIPTKTKVARVKRVSRISKRDTILNSLERLYLLRVSKEITKEEYLSRYSKVRRELVEVN